MREACRRSPTPRHPIWLDRPLRPGTQKALEEQAGQDAISIVEREVRAKGAGYVAAKQIAFPRKDRDEEVEQVPVQHANAAEIHISDND